VTDRSSPKLDVVIGEDWDDPKQSADEAMTEGRARRGFLSLRSSPIARKIVLFNLLGLVILVAGVLFLNPGRDSLVEQRETALVSEARLLADVFEAQLPKVGPLDFAANDGVDTDGTLEILDLPADVRMFLFDTTGNLIAKLEGAGTNITVDTTGGVSGILLNVWSKIDGLISGTSSVVQAISIQEEARRLLDRSLGGDTVSENSFTADTGTVFLVTTPIARNGDVVGVIALATVGGKVDQLARQEREKILQMFLIAAVVSIGLSLLLASTIANPLADLALAAELGRDRNARTMSPSQVRIPDMTARPDEIGRLSGAMRGMVRALYDRIEGNEQFAADVAHEIKNPLASLRSAIGTLRIAKTDDQRGRLYDVIEHDVRRLDRLVSDISNASRLDSELVKEEEARFDLTRTLSHLLEYHGSEAATKGIEFISDVPNEPIFIHGLEGRLAQVFVNLITNAISFCEDGDAVRVWVRKRDNRVLVVVEDTGPGIPENALHKVFNRFYSERPVAQFGDHSGLGLAISKQIVDAHGGVIWAENIRPTDADIGSEPLGARFVVGLPV